MMAWIPSHQQVDLLRYSYPNTMPMLIILESFVDSQLFLSDRFGSISPWKRIFFLYGDLIQLSEINKQP